MLVCIDVVDKVEVSVVKSVVLVFSVVVVVEEESVVLGSVGVPVVVGKLEL